MNDRVRELMELRYRIDAELASMGITVEKGQLMYQANTITPIEGEYRPTPEDEQLAKEFNEYLEFQRFNVGTHFPGWRSRLGQTWGGQDYK